MVTLTVGLRGVACVIVSTGQQSKILQRTDEYVSAPKVQ
jgi:hypothetical protein